MDTLAFGEVLWDVIQGEEHLGGAPFNVAAHLARLGCRSHLISRVGEDDRGRRILDRMRSLGIRENWVQRDSLHPTGVVEVRLDTEGQPSYNILEAAWDHIETGGEALQALGERTWDAFIFGTLAQRSPVSRAALTALRRAVRARVVLYDINLRPGCEDLGIVRLSLKGANIVKLNDHEARLLGPWLFGAELTDQELANRLCREFGADVVCLTRGAEGCSVYWRGNCEHVAGTKVKVADAVGAGDAFAAAFLCRYIAGSTPPSCAAFANRLGAYVAARHGAVPVYDAEIMEFLAHPD